MRIVAMLAAAAVFSGPVLRAESPREALGRYSVSFLGVAGQSTLTTFDTGVDKGFAEVYAPAVETAMFVSRRIELGFSVDPWIGVSQPVTRDGRGRERVSAFAADLLVRYYPGDLWRDWRPYVELAEGPSYATERVPSTGTQFNFLSEVGFGFVIVRRDRWRLQAGYRLVHFSNAGLGAHNPSWNFNGLLLGGRWSPRPSPRPAADPGGPDLPRASGSR